jgi:hypothetical protein
MITEDGDLGEYRFELESVRDGIISWQRYNLNVVLPQEAVRVTEDQNNRATESGLIRITEQ